MRRLGLVVLGLILGLLVAEAALQGLRSLGLARVEPPPPSTGPGPIVVCVGDSHTYGFRTLREVESYPAQLARRLAPLGVQVENLGWPGLNGAQIAARLQQRLQAGRVDLVLVLAGFNNSWNPAAAAEESRWVLPRLWRILRSHDAGTGTDDFVIVDGRPHWRQPDGTLRPITTAEASEDLRTGSALQESVQQDLEAVLRVCGEGPVPVVLQTYASVQNERFTASNAAARQVAAASDVPLVDHAEWFREQGVKPQDALQEDGHPNVVGYGHMAQALVDALPSLPVCVDWNWPALGGAVTPQDNADAFIQMTRQSPAADGTQTFEVHGPPGGVWLLGVSRSLSDESGPLKIRRDEAFEQCRSLEGLHGRLDREGRGWARLYPGLAAQLGEGPFHLQVLLIDPQAPPETMLRAASPRVHPQESWPR